jgi:hypothetical protein
MNRAVSGMLCVQESGRPLPGFQVVAVRLSQGSLEPLGVSVSGDLGRFRIQYEPLPEPADLTLLVYAEGGRLVYTEPVHRAIAGAELRLHVEVPYRALTAGLH